MNSNNPDYFKNIYLGKNNRKYEYENKPLNKSNNYIKLGIKQGTYDQSRPRVDYLTENSYDISKLYGNNSYYNRYKYSTLENLKNNKQNKNNKLNIIQTEYNLNRNDVMRNNNTIFYSERAEKNKGRSISSTKIKRILENTILNNNQKITKFDGNNLRNMNKVELNNNSRNDGNLYLVNSNKNTSIKIINKTKSYINANRNEENKQKMFVNDRRKNKNDIYILDNNLNLNNNNGSQLYEKNNNKYNKYSTKIADNNIPIKMNAFEISYESDKEEKNSYNNYKNNNIINKKLYTKYISKNKNRYNTNNNLEEKDKNNNNDDKDLNNISYNKYSYNSQKNYQYKYQYIPKYNNEDKKGININDSIELKDIHNNKYISIITGERQNVKHDTNMTPKIKQNKSNISKNKENKILTSNSIRDNKSIDAINNSNIIKRIDDIPNVSAETSILYAIPNIINKRNSNTYFINNTNNSLSKIKKNENNKNKNNFRNFYRLSDKKKIILIQSVYRAYSLKLQLNKNLHLYAYFKEIFCLLQNIVLLRKKNYWRFFLYKLSKGSTVKLVNKKKSKKKSISKNNNNSKSLLNTSNKVKLKNKDIIVFQKVLNDSFNIINDKNNDLKVKLDDMIKENNELKNQIANNKNIEEKIKQLQIENKKNQNINAIIMKDNQQLARRLKNIQDNRNNQLVIQNQNPIELEKAHNMQSQSLSKLKNLYLKSLVFKTIMKNNNIIKSFFNKYKNNVKKNKNKTYTIENSNIFINNKKKINIQMTNNFNINFISQNDNYKHFQLNKILLKKEKEKLKIISKYFYKFLYLTKYMKLLEEEERRKEEKEKEIINNENEQKRNILQSIIDKYERNNDFLCKKFCKEWRLRSVIFRMKGIAKELKKKKKLKRKMRDKLAKETLNNLKNKTSQFQSAHEFSYKIEKTGEEDDILKSQNIESSKNEDNKNKEENNVIKEEEDVKNENNISDHEDSQESLD